MSTHPLTHDDARSAAREVLDFPGADGVEVLFGASSAGLTRYARSEIIQNTARTEVKAYVRVVVGDRIGSATTNQLDAEHLRRTAAQALEVAKASLPDPEFPGLARPDEVGRPEPIMKWDDDTADASPDDRAQAVKRILAATGADNAAGIYETSAHAYAVLTSSGVDCFDAFTRCTTTCLVDLGSSTGWGEDSSYRSTDVDEEAAARRAHKKAEIGVGAVDAEPGLYEVVLEPSAVATLLDYLAFTGFGAKQMLEGESFLSARLGEMVAAPLVTIADDARHPRSVGIGFDFEGVPKRRVAVIDHGKASEPVGDLRTARKMGVEPSGHASGSGEFGPYAANVVMETGDKSFEELVGNVDEGLLVTRFHYVNILDRPATLLTGMTRDGTFRISNGEIAEPVHNFRFTQSVLAALATAQSLGRDLHSFAPEFGSFGSTAAPALRVGEFHFSSRTSH